MLMGTHTLPFHHWMTTHPFYHLLVASFDGATKHREGMPKVRMGSLEGRRQYDPLGGNFLALNSPRLPTSHAASVSSVPTIARVHCL